ncbi:hypothetical protein ACIHFE_20960 [Streptomyces sp. NPDC052396]|uniref:hypothetical protein n=1 Tax=Streptomyces sp. NPDC052396 TaxID=3365689 RepID=UPI0037D5B085
MRKLSRAAIRTGAAAGIALAAVSATIEPSAAAGKSMIIDKRDGSGETRPMAQPQAESYMVNVLKDQRMLNKQASLKQALNQAFNGGGKATGGYTFRNHPVLHASSGDGQTSTTLFYFNNDANTMTLFAVGEHLKGPSTRYQITVYGQAGTDFAQGRTISL